VSQDAWQVWLEPFGDQAKWGNAAVHPVAGIPQHAILWRAGGQQRFELLQSVGQPRGSYRAEAK